jgi:hypothetical protein
MATLVGTNTVTAIARHYIMPKVTDQVYRKVPLLARLQASNRMLIRGGTQIEVPLMYGRFNTGGPYSGYDVWNTTPSDTIRNAVWDWKQHYVTWAVDGLTLLRTDSPDAIASFLMLQAEQARMEMTENLAIGLDGGGSTGAIAGYFGAGGAATSYNDVKDIDGINAMLGTGSTLGNANYGGISRTANSWWNATVDSSTATLTEAALQSMFTSFPGGNTPTLIRSRVDQYNRFYALNLSTTNPRNYNREPAGHDALLASAGFTNLLFNQVPWIHDPHVVSGTANNNNSAIQMLNENYLHWIVSPRGDFVLKDFVEPANQDAMVAGIKWAGNLVTTNCQVHGVMTAITA